MQFPFSARLAAPRKPRGKPLLAFASSFHASSHERRRSHAIDRLEARLVLSSMSVVTLPADLVSATGADAQRHRSIRKAQRPPYSFQYSTDPAFTPTVQTTLGSGFNSPDGVAVDAAGDVFVADTGNNAVKEIPAGGGAIQTLALRRLGASGRGGGRSRRRVRRKFDSWVWKRSRPAAAPACPRFGLLRAAGRGSRCSRRRVRRRHRQQRRQGDPGRRRRHPDARLRLRRSVRRGGGHGRQCLRRRLWQSCRQGNPGRRRRHPDARLRLRLRAVRAAWRWTQPATCSSPTPATTPSRRSRPTAAPSRRLVPASTIRRAWRWMRPATCSSPTTVTTASSSCRRRAWPATPSPLSGSTATASRPR